MVAGEVSNLVRHSSGHVYFTLKDAHAQLSCAMFKGVAMQYLRNLPGHGEQVVVQGDISVYPPRGGYQLIVRAISKAGQEGDLHRRFVELKAKLEAEGLFDPSVKRPLPAIPKKIGVVTSPTGAVIRDICHTLKRRFPHVEVLLVPTVVQGEKAAGSIVDGIKKLNGVGDVDVILLARGGGSLEDLWAFNEEAVARAIRASGVPVVAGIGHETDSTIADFVADLRAATPTAAAELVVPVAAQLRTALDEAAGRLKRNLVFYIDTRRQSLDELAYRLEKRMETHLEIKRQWLKEQERALMGRMEGALDKARHELDLIEARMSDLDLRQVLERGFSITEHGGKVVRSVAELEEGDVLTTYFFQGKAQTRVEKLEHYE